MAILLQMVFNALIAGSLNALLAAGFSVIYSTNRFVYLAHGAVVTVSAYILFTATSGWGIPFWVACFLTISLTALLGAGIYFCLFYPLRRRKTSASILLIASAAVLFLIMNILTLVYGANVKSLDVLPVQEGINVYGARVTLLQIVIVAAAVVVFVLLWGVMKYSTFGKMLRSVADNPELAATTGINTTKIEAYSFLLGSALAAVTGILVSLEQYITPYVGTHLAVTAYTSAIIGGIASVPGAIVGGYVLGAVQNFGIWFLPSGWKEGITFSVLLMFLLFRPNGILGVNKGARNN